MKESELSEAEKSILRKYGVELWGLMGEELSNLKKETKRLNEENQTFRALINNLSQGGNTAERLDEIEERLNSSFSIQSRTNSTVDSLAEQNLSLQIASIDCAELKKEMVDLKNSNNQINNKITALDTIVATLLNNQRTQKLNGSGINGTAAVEERIKENEKNIQLKLNEFQEAIKEINEKQKKFEKKLKNEDNHGGSLRRTLPTHLEPEDIEEKWTLLDNMVETLSHEVTNLGERSQVSTNEISDLKQSNKLIEREVFNLNLSLSQLTEKVELLERTINKSICLKSGRKQIRQISDGLEDDFDMNRHKDIKRNVERNQDQDFANHIKSPDEENLLTELSGIERHPNQTTSVLLLGGYRIINQKKRTSRKIFLYNSRGEDFVELNIETPREIRDAGAVVLNGEVYVVGGFSYKSCYKLNSDGWEKLANMNEERSFTSTSCVAYNNSIWVFGGYNRQFTLKSAERFDAGRNQWIKLPDMLVPRARCAAAVNNDEIFVSGGSNKDSTALQSVEVFDISQNCWKMYCKMPNGLHSHCMLFYNKNLLILGGFNGVNDFGSVWKYNRGENKWQSMKRFKQNRRCFGAAVFPEKAEIIIFGGHNDDTIEIFNGREWNYGPELRYPVSQFAYTPISRAIEESLLAKIK